jgi:hypothetical protein
VIPYFQKDGIVLYHGDCRELLPTLNNDFVVLTGPPWHEQPEVAMTVLGLLRNPTIICQWNEISRPPCQLPLVAAHIWINVDAEGIRYQPFYHYDSDGLRRRSAIFQYPEHQRTHPHDFPVELAQALLMKARGLTVIDPFAGTCATLIAARNLKRKAIGIEMDERRCEAGAKRLSGEN